MKKSYTKPTVEKVGNFESVTKAAGTGSAVDAVFPIGTPNDALTFS